MMVWDLWFINWYFVLELLYFKNFEAFGNSIKQIIDLYRTFFEPQKIFFQLKFMKTSLIGLFVPGIIEITIYIALNSMK